MARKWQHVAIHPESVLLTHWGALSRRCPVSCAAYPADVIAQQTEVLRNSPRATATQAAPFDACGGAQAGDFSLRQFLARTLYDLFTVLILDWLQCVAPAGERNSRRCRPAAPQ